MEQLKTRLPNETDEQFDIRMNKDMAAFSYIWIMSIVVYFSRKDSPFVKFHSVQGIVLFLITIPLSFIPYVGKYLMFLPVSGMLMGFLNAARGERRDVPLAGLLSRGELSIADALHMMKSTAITCGDTLKGLFRSHTSSPSSPTPPPSPSTVDKPKPFQ